MSSEQPRAFRWGVISTGGISTAVTKDLLIDPTTRGVHDVVHKIVAIGSRTKEKAQQFIDEVVKDPSTKAYGSYQEVYDDPNVDAIYIGTPHTYHYTNALDAIKAKKHVLCEKPVTCNAAELKSLIAAAKENNVFFMEALWTRFQPLSFKVKKVLEEGSLGLPIVVHADLSGDFNINEIPKTHRILDPELGGGAILDLGPYPMVWAIMTLFEHPANKLRSPTSIIGSMVKTRLTGVDRNTSFTVNFDHGDDFSAQAILSCSINLTANQPGVTIRCEKGTIKIQPPIYSPRTFSVEYLDGKGNVTREEKETFEYVGKGWHYQADEVARRAWKGELESSLWGHNKSILEMEIFDEVRRQGGYKFPEGVEKVLL